MPRSSCEPACSRIFAADAPHARSPGRPGREAVDGALERGPGPSPAGGVTGSHEAIYQWIYALPMGPLAAKGITLAKGRTKRRARKIAGERSARIVGMVSIDEWPEDARDRKVPGHWEGGLIVGKGGQSAAITLVERTTRFLCLLALPEGKAADGVCDVLVDHVQGLPELVRNSLTGDQGTEMGRHAALRLATELKVYFANPHAPRERPTNENTNGLVRCYLPKSTEIPDHQPYLHRDHRRAEQLPRKCLDLLTPRSARWPGAVHALPPTRPPTCAPALAVERWAVGGLVRYVATVTSRMTGAPGRAPW